MENKYLEMIENLLGLNGILETIIESSTNGIIELNEEGRILRGNPAFCQILEREFIDAQGESFYDYIVEEDIIQDLKEAIRQTRSVFFRDFVINIKKVNEGDNRKFIELKIVPIPSNRQARFIGIIKDKTDVLRALCNRETFITSLLNLIEDINVDNRSTIYHLAFLVELRDSNTGEHLERVEAYTRLLATEYFNAYGERDKWVTESYVEDMAISAVLHDIGKVGITDSILLKPSGLSEAEMTAMKEHTLIAGKALEKHRGKKDFLAIGREIALSHHEKWNGKGYPRQLKGKDIPLSGRIVSLCDTYDAITHDRPYKKALSHKEAVKIITAEKGLSFDPEIVDQFLRIHPQFEKVNFSRPDHIQAGPVKLY